MKVTNEALWADHVSVNTEPYGARIVSYARDWADLMELEMEAGRRLEDVAQATASRADTDGITGFMYGCAVQVLAECWEHGETLRRWHNLDIQIGTEGEQANESGGTLNPALLFVG